jgi:hypothetical protein
MDFWMKSLTLLFILLASNLSSPAFAGEFEEIENIINTSPFLTSKCAPASRICTLYPLSTTTSQEFANEISLIEPHLTGMGITIKRDFLWMDTTSLGTQKREKFFRELSQGEKIQFLLKRLALLE